MDVEVEEQISKTKFTGPGRPPRSLGKISKGPNHLCSPARLHRASAPIFLSCTARPPLPCKMLVAAHKQAALCLVWHFLLNVRRRELARGLRTQGKALSCPPRQIQLLELQLLPKAQFPVLPRSCVPVLGAGREKCPSPPRSSLAMSSAQQQNLPTGCSQPIPAAQISPGCF